MLFRDPSLTNCPPTTDPWAGHTVLSQGGPYCPPCLKTFFLNEQKSPWLEAMEKKHMKDVDRDDLLSLTEASDLECLGEDVGFFKWTKAMVISPSVPERVHPRKLTWNPRNCWFFPWPFSGSMFVFRGFSPGFVDLWFPGETPEDDDPPRQTGIFRGADRNEVWAPAGGLERGKLVIWLMATRNPANQLRLVVEIPLFTGFYTSQVVHDFLNQPYFWRELEGGSIPREVCMVFFLVGGKIIQRGMWNFYGLV